MKKNRATVCPICKKAVQAEKSEDGWVYTIKSHTNYKGNLCPGTGVISTGIRMKKRR